jgi:hypothetical protein
MTVIAAATEGNDGTVMRIAQMINSPYTIVPVTRVDDFRFNEDLIGVKEAVLLDMVEYGWNWDEKRGTHLFGLNTNGYAELFPGEEWAKFDEWVKGLDKCVYFKRELLAADRPKNVYPLNYPCWHTVPEPQNREEFENRPLQVHFSWGLSHEDRKRVHAEIWLMAGKYGYSVCDNPYFLEDFIEHENTSKRWFTANIPHYKRLPMENILYINGKSKISISLPGAGKCCFRHSESPVNSVMYMWEDGLQWSIPWVNGVNCIKSDPGKEIETIIGWLNSPDLYQVYLDGVNTCKQYEAENYIQNYILPIING